VKTTLELPDELFRSAKSKAAAQGRSLKDLFTEALRDKLAEADRLAGSGEPPWKKLAGAFGGSAEERREIQRVQQRIDEEFGQIDALE
jgi:hypothetical protein